MLFQLTRQNSLVKINKVSNELCVKSTLLILLNGSAVVPHLFHS